jgi:rhomboid family GlyGly-CTERM serine protease
VIPPHPESRASFPIPLITGGLVLAGIALLLRPRWAEPLAFDRAAIESGELWRLLTGHLVHVDLRLALFDLVAVAAFGAWVERKSRALVIVVVLTSALAASFGVLVATDHARYVGSSALASGLLTAGAVQVLRVSGDPRRRVLAGLLLAGFATKLALEALGVWPTAWGALPEEIEPVGAAHLLGALAGATAGWFHRTRSAPGSRSRSPTHRSGG